MHGSTARHRARPPSSAPCAERSQRDKAFGAEDLVNELCSMTATALGAQSTGAAEVWRSTGAGRGTLCDQRSASVSASVSRKPSAGRRKPDSAASVASAFPSPSPPCLQSPAIGKVPGGGRLMAKVLALTKSLPAAGPRRKWRDRLRRPQCPLRLSSKFGLRGVLLATTKATASAAAATLGTAGRLVCHFYIHKGDHSRFAANRDSPLRRPANRYPGHHCRSF
jgi:hypothetical protein